MIISYLSFVGIELMSVSKADSWCFSNLRVQS